MGNCCSSSSAYEDTQSSPQYSTFSRPPKPRVTGQGRTLGGGGDDGGASDIDPRQRAALAAQGRTSAQGGGKLANQLASEQSKSRRQQLQAAYNERAEEPQNLTWD